MKEGSGEGVGQRRKIKVLNLVEKEKSRLVAQLLTEA